LKSRPDDQHVKTGVSPTCVSFSYVRMLSLSEPGAWPLVSCSEGHVSLEPSCNQTSGVLFQGSHVLLVIVPGMCSGRLTYPCRLTRDFVTYLTVYGLEQRRLFLGELARIREDVVRVVEPPRLLELPLTWQSTRKESGGGLMRQDALAQRLRHALDDLFNGYALHQ
jgi:hypothetical protein